MIRTIAVEDLPLGDVLFDGQSLPGIISASCRVFAIQSYSVVLLDCSDEVRSARLRQRGHEFLAVEPMLRWAHLLRRDCSRRSLPIIDTSGLSVAAVASAVRVHITTGAAARNPALSETRL